MGSMEVGGADGRRTPLNLVGLLFMVNVMLYVYRSGVCRS